MSQELYLLAGGASALRAVLEDFYERVFDDVMIGFFFRGKDRERLVEKELEFAMQLLGADVEYTGRTIVDAHGSHRIMGGQFARRTQILRETMRDHGLPEPVQQAWIKHTEELRDQVTKNAHGHCNP